MCEEMCIQWCWLCEQTVLGVQPEHNNTGLLDIGMLSINMSLD